MKRLIAALLLILVLALPASAVSQSIDKDIANAWGVQFTNYVVDEETGVNYIVITGWEGRNGASCVSICPRYNADGTLYVTEAK